MNVDEAMAIVNSSNLAAEWYDGSLSEAVGVLRAEIERLRAELEKERMRLAACGVVAMSNTKESLSKVMAEIHPDYLCASVDDVKRAVEREIELRAELAACQNLLDETRTELSICGALHAVAKKEWQLEVEKVNRLEVELAAAKAASVCPIEIESVYINKYLGSAVVFIGNEQGAVEFEAWLRDRMKENQ